MTTRVAEAAMDAPFEAMLAPHYDGLVRGLAFIVGDPDEGRDLAQAAYLRAFEAWARFDGADARAWLYTIGINLAISERRRRWRWHGATPTIDPAWFMEVDPDLWLAIAGLDRRHRAALLMNVLDGYTQAEIGRLLGVPPGTVASWLSRAKARLRERLGEER
ncbi:MAG: RNA polymerase sigma factor [Chloroflexi bacterium]|nr:RNA polymerase sigma factor [Chloroflexota bacterium]